MPYFVSIHTSTLLPTLIEFRRSEHVMLCMSTANEEGRVHTPAVEQYSPSGP